MRARHRVPDGVHSPGGNIVFTEKGNIVFPEHLLSPCYIGQPSTHLALSKKPSPFSRRPLDSQGHNSLDSTWINKGSPLRSQHTPKIKRVEGHTVRTIHILKVSCAFHLNSLHFTPAVAWHTQAPNCLKRIDNKPRCFFKCKRIT